MRRPVFKRWIAEELKYLSGNDSLSLRKLAAQAQGELPRLREPLLLYAIATGKTERLLELLWDTCTQESYKAVLDLLQGDTDLQALSLEESSTRLPREYEKFLLSYRAAYAKPETIAESKRMRWERSRELQLKKGVSTAEIYNSLHLNPGNINAYMKYGNVDKVSLKSATDIMKYLFAY